ncbi:MAG: SRPBCC family protein [Opitutales bacterium]
MKSNSDQPDYVYVTYIHTTPQKLWRALIDPALITQYWLGRTQTTTWKRGDSIETRDADGELEWHGKIVVNRPPRRLAYTFQMDGRDQPVTHVTFDIEKIEQGDELHGMGVKLTVTHRGYAQGSRQLRGISWGWPVILSGLKSLLETGRVLAKSR